MTIFKYGGYSHPANEVNLTRMDARYVMSPRGRRESKIVTMYLRGELQDTGTPLLSAIANLNAVYATDYQDAALYLDDGTETPHSLKNNQFSMTGVRIIHRSFPQGDGAELATKRTFSVTLQSEYIDAADGLLAWQEELEFIGDCGPRIEVEETFFGPIGYVTAVATAQRIVQRGHAIGLTAYVAPNGPTFGNTDHQERRRLKFRSGRMRGAFATHFGTAWQYEYTSSIPQSGVPDTR